MNICTNQPGCEAATKAQLESLFLASHVLSPASDLDFTACTVKCSIEKKHDTSKKLVKCLTFHKQQKEKELIRKVFDHKMNELFVLHKTIK